MTTDRLLSPEDVGEAAAWFARSYTGWTWPELLRALRAVLPPDIARDAGQALLEQCPAEPRRPAQAVLTALRPWTAPSHDRTRVVTVQEPARSPALADGLPALYTVVDLARWLDVTVPELEWFADHGGWLRQADPRLRHYQQWTRHKRDGVRLIEAPKPRLRETQRRILHHLLSRIPVHRAARGFAPGSSPATFALPHAGAPTVLRADLRHCFESITVARVTDVFRLVGYPPAVARTLADLCTTATPADALGTVPRPHAAYLRGRHLPQGAPTSPHLSNLVMRSLDRRLQGYAAANDLQYTRYGDDLALSGHNMDADKALWVLLRVIASEGFTVHSGKVRIMREHQQQILAGLVVNDRPRVPRREYDAVRALLHNARRYGAASQNRSGHPDFRAHVLGLIAWIGASDPGRRARLLQMAADVEWQS